MGKQGFPGTNLFSGKDQVVGAFPERNSWLVDLLIPSQIYCLRELKQNELGKNAEREGKRQRIAEMADFLNVQPHELEEYDVQLVRRIIEKVTVFDDMLIVEFKSGVEVDIEL